jgi:acyl carrier protein
VAAPRRNVSAKHRGHARPIWDHQILFPDLIKLGGREIMALPEAVITYLNENAAREGVPTPQPDHDLFKLGILDSFSLVDFVSILETQFNIRITDSDVNPENFRSIEVIERYIDTR